MSEDKNNVDLKINGKKKRKEKEQNKEDKNEEIEPKKQKTEKKESKYNKYIHGNYEHYYGYRSSTGKQIDERVLVLKNAWFFNKRVLDIGCNVGKVTNDIAKKYQPSEIIGMDIDQKLIDEANRKIQSAKKYAPISEKPTNFPISIQLSLGRLKPVYPHNVSYICGNVTEVNLPEKLDCIICFSTTKWIHLNFGDEGIKTTFRKVRDSLIAGGLFILEPQAWDTYKKKARINQTLRDNYKNIKLKPEQFVEYLSKELNFELIDTLQPENENESFERPIYVLKKTEGKLVKDVEI